MKLREGAVGQLRALRDQQGSLLERVIQVYADESTLLIGRIEAALESDDREALRLAAHTLGSAGAQFGADEFCATCRQMERIAADGDGLDAARALFPRLRAEFDEAAELIAALGVTD